MATAKPQERPARPQMMLAVDLVPVQTINVPVEAGVAPPPRVRSEPAPERADPQPRRAAGPATSNPVAPNAADAGGDSVYLGPPSILTDPKGPPGLRGLMDNDPCANRIGPKSKECVGKELAARTGPMDSVMARSKDQLAQHFGDYMPTCALRVGCEGGEWISTSGMRSTGRAPPGSAGDRGVGTPGAGGASSLGGLHTSVGRLGHNDDHRDTGFGD